MALSSSTPSSVNNTLKIEETVASDGHSSDDHSSDDPAWLVVINVVIGTCGILGNTLVVVIFLLRAKRTFKNWTQMYILHQSTIDGLASCIFLFLRFFNDVTFLENGGPRERFACKFWFSEYLLWSLFMCSTYNLVLVSMERFLAIVKPVFHRNQMSRKRVLLTMLIPWLWAFVFQSYWPPVYELFGTACYPVWRQPWLQPFFGVLTFVFEYFLPLLLMLAAYGTIIYKLKGMSDKREQNNNRITTVNRDSVMTNPGVSTISDTLENQNPTGKNDQAGVSKETSKVEPNMYSKAKKNVIKTLLTVFTVYALSWTPTEVEFLLYNLGIIEIDFSGTIYRILSLIVLANMIANPLIYAGYYRDFQHSLRVVLRRCGINRVDIESQTVVDSQMYSMDHGHKG